MQHLLFLLLMFAVLMAECSESEVCDVDTDLPPCRPEVSRGTGCGCVFNATKARCCHFQLKHAADYFDNCGVMNSSDLTALFLFNCTTDDGQSVRTLDLTLLARRYTSLETLAVTGADYRSINLETGSGHVVEGFSKLQCLNVSNNILQNSTAIANVIDSIPSLQIIDVASNNLTFVPNISSRVDFWMHIANNKNLKCDGIDELMINNITKFLHPGQTECLKTVNITQWMSASGDTIRMNLSSIVSTNMINRDCPRKCVCSKSRIRTDGISVMVNCSGIGLYKMPDGLPLHTVTLDISHNHIKDLRPILRNKNYEYLTTLYADDNKIEDLAVLEGSKFLEEFNILSLQKNKISKIPHFMSKVKGNAGFTGYKQMRLSENKFKCDCETEVNVKGFLVQQTQTVSDSNDIMCDNIIGVKVMDLELKDVCLNTEEINYIYYIITAEVILLLLLVGKVSYDYWVFKHAGYLPWPASKMPRLPCDCVLET